ncbi:unnamed protein product, partial [Iphiclides podalirius]
MNKTNKNEIPNGRFVRYDIWWRQKAFAYGMSVARTWKLRDVLLRATCIAAQTRVAVYVVRLIAAMERAAAVMSRLIKGGSVPGVLRYDRSLATTQRRVLRILRSPPSVVTHYVR